MRCCGISKIIRSTGKPRHCSPSGALLNARTRSTRTKKRDVDPREGVMAFLRGCIARSKVVGASRNGLGRLSHIEVHVARIIAKGGGGGRYARCSMGLH